MILCFAKPRPFPNSLLPSLSPLTEALSIVVHICPRHLTALMTRSTPAFRAPNPDFYAIIDADPYLLPLIQFALSKQFSDNAYGAISSLDQLPYSSSPLLQIAPYESLDFVHLIQHPYSSLANSYVIRKALIRKHYLHNTITSWWSKHPDDTNMKGHVPLTVAFEVDYAEFLDEALAECWELHASFAREEREWWVLKPGMR